MMCCQQDWSLPAAFIVQLDAVLHMVLANWTSYDVPFRMYLATICAALDRQLLQTGCAARYC